MRDFLEDFFYYLGEALSFVLATALILFFIAANISGVVLFVSMFLFEFTWVRLCVFAGIVFMDCVVYALWNAFDL